MSVCPVPIERYPVVTLAHGGGGRLTQQLIADLLARALANEHLETRHDAAVVPAGNRIALTTDSFVVQPLFFPGGDIGRLAVFGTVNDLLMSGARPAWLTLGLILEEGLPMETLWNIMRSVATAAREAGIQIVTGDTKVVERGKGDGLFINTTGVGILEREARIHPDRVQPGDALILSGNVGRHGMAILSEREGLRFASPLRSDCASLRAPVETLLNTVDVHCLRDCTRGGVAAAAHEIAEAAALQIVLQQESIPALEGVRGACELLGLDPIHVANEGRFIALVAQQDVDSTLSILRTFESSAALIGRVEAGSGAPLRMDTPYGQQRIVDLPSGEQLPRIC